MAIQSVRHVERCYEEGRYWQASFRKVPAIASSAGVWSDLSGAPGNPKPNYFIGIELSASPFDGTWGMYHGGNVSPYNKHIHKILIQSVSAGHAPAEYKILDYLAFYPLIDMDSTEEQILTNTYTIPRFSDGLGVEAMLVATNPYLGSAQFFINYTGYDNQQYQSHIETSNTATLIGAIVHSGMPTLTGSGPFIRRSQMCRGIKQVDSITFLSPNGGIAALVLVKPLATFMINETTAPCEYDFLTMKMSLPKIYDGAYINMIGSSGSSWAAAPINGLFTTIWG
jgi:hypothetical protein